MPKLGVVFGTANAALEGRVLRLLPSDTPFGSTPSPVYEFMLPSAATIICAHRHGDGHVFSPSMINYRAIVFTMKMFGVTHLLSFSAVGSLREEIFPGKTIFIPTQIFDDTKGIRKHTFFEGDDDVVAHISLADPICRDFATLLDRVFSRVNSCFCTLLGGTYVVIDGPAYSTRAKSLFYKGTLGAHVVGMTAWPEAGLTREAGMHYGVICTPADYDSWRPDQSGVDADEVKKGLAPFANLPNMIIPDLVEALRERNGNSCATACPNALTGFAIHSDRNKVRPEKNGKYIPLLP